MRGEVRGGGGEGGRGGDAPLWPPGGARGQQVTRPESFNGIYNAAGRGGALSFLWSLQAVIIT